MMTAPARSTMRRPAIHGLAALAITATLAFGPAVAVAQDSALPAARTLVDKHIAASGGRAAVERASAGRATGTFSIPSAGLTGPLTMYSAPNRQAMRIELAGLGEIRSGFDGTTAWSLDPMNGARVLEGAEREVVADASKPGAGLRDSTAVRSMETTSREEIGGVACYKVRVVWNSGRESHDCYAVESGLLHASMSVVPSPMGDMAMTMLMQDYTDFQGVKMPAKMVQQVAGQEMMTTITAMDVSTPAADVFALPPEIQALVKPAGAGSR